MTSRSSFPVSFREKCVTVTGVMQRFSSSDKSGSTLSMRETGSAVSEVSGSDVNSQGVGLST